MKYDIFEGNMGVSLGKEIESGYVEEFLKGFLENITNAPMRFALIANLPLSLSATVTRAKGHLEAIVLKSGEEIHEVIRNTSDQKGPFGASCDPRGDEVRAETLNLKFREIDDPFTDRGVVWVQLEKGSLFFVVNRQAVNNSGLVTQIVKEAETAVKGKLLDLFN